MSENRIAASSRKRSSGCSVTSQASSGVVQSCEEAAGPRARGPVLGQVAPGLAHHPDRRARRRLAQQRAQQQVVAQRRAQRDRSPNTSAMVCLDRLRGGARVGRVADRPADDDVIGAVGEGLRDVDGALLVVDRLVLDRTDAGRHDQQALVDAAGAASLPRDPEETTPSQPASSARRARGQHELLDVAGEPEVVEVAAIEAREHGHGEDLDVAFRRGRGFHDRLVAVHRRQRDARGSASGSRPPRRSRARRRTSGRRRPCLPRATIQSSSSKYPPDMKQLEAKLVELHRVAEPVHEPRAPRRRSATSSAKISRSRSGIDFGTSGMRCCSRQVDHWYLRCARRDRTAGGARGSRSGRSCPRYSPRRRARDRAAVRPPRAAAPLPGARSGIRSMSSNSASNSSRNDAPRLGRHAQHPVVPVEVLAQETLELEVLGVDLRR